MASSGQFDSDYADPNYRCCCGCMHATTGAKVLAIIELILLTPSIVVYAIVAPAQLPSLTISIAFAASLYYGVRDEKSAFVLVNLIFRVSTYVGASALFVVLGIHILIGTNVSRVLVGNYMDHQIISSAEPVSSTALVIGLVIFFAIVSAFAIWFIHVVLRAYQFIRIREIGGIPTQQQQQQQQSMAYKPYDAIALHEP